MEKQKTINGKFEIVEVDEYSRMSGLKLKKYIIENGILKIDIWKLLLGVYQTFPKRWVYNSKKTYDQKNPKEN